MTTIDKILIIVAAMCIGFALAVFLVSDKFIEAKRYYGWFLLTVSSILNLVRMFTPKPKEEPFKFDFETP